MKEIEKYVGYYLLVYFVVLSICGFFQYFYHCQGQSLVCAFSMDGINTIITTTASVITPIVAIIGFLNWKKQKQYDLEKTQAEKLINLLNETNSEIYKKYSLIQPLYSIRENIIVIPSLEHNRIDLSKINNFEIILQELKLLNRILDTEDHIDIQLQKNLYFHFHFFDNFLTMIENHYLNHYYPMIKDDLKVSEDTNSIDLNNHDPHFDASLFINSDAGRRIISDQIYKIINIENITTKITDPLSKEVNESDKTFAEYKEDYDQSFNDLVKELVQVIKPHKKTALTDGL